VTVKMQLTVHSNLASTLCAHE